MAFCISALLLLLFAFFFFIINAMYFYAYFELEPVDCQEKTHLIWICLEAIEKRKQVHLQTFVHSTEASSFYSYPKNVLKSIYFK